MSKKKKTTDNPNLEGFKNLAAETMAPDNLEIKDVDSIPEEVVQDTGIIDTTEKEEKEEVVEEKKIDLTPENLEIEYKKEVEPEEKTGLEVEKVEEEESVEDSEVSQISVLANYLKEEGIIDFNEEEFEDTEEGFQGLIQNEIKKGISQYKTDLDPLAQEFIEYIEKGGNPQNFVRATSDVDFSKISDDQIKGKESIQKQLVAEFMRREGYTQDEIMADISDFVDSGIIERRASQSLIKLKRIQETQRKKLITDQETKAEEKEKEYSTFLGSLKDDIESREEIAGFPITTRQKKDFYEYITKANRKTGKTRLVTDSEGDKDSQLKMAWLYYNNFDFSKIEKKARTKAASSLRANLERASGVSTKKLKSKTRTRASGEDIDFSLFEKALGNK